MKKKILIFVLIFLILISFFTSSFCSYNIDIGEKTYQLPDDFNDYPYRIFLYAYTTNPATYGFVLLASNSEITATSTYNSYLNNTFLTFYSEDPFIYCSGSYGNNYDSTFNETKTDFSYYSHSIDGGSIAQNGSHIGYYVKDVTYYNYDSLVYHVYTPNDIKNADNSNEIIINKTSVTPTITYPYFINENEFETGKFESINISDGTYDSLENNLYLHVAEINNQMVEDLEIPYYLNEKVFKLDMSSSYYHPDNKLKYIVPKNKLGFNLENSKDYVFILSSSANSIANLTEEQIFTRKEFTVTGLSDSDILGDKQDITNEKLDEQTDAIKENTETNKGIWETIKDILSYINPFSENFFVYRLIELLVDAIKSLFIPSDDFFSTYFTDLKEWFSDRLGFLFYPFELVIDILNKILNINFSEPQLNIPDMNEPFTNKKLISATTFNFNDLLDNQILNTVHSIYLVCVDAFIVFCLVNLARRKWEEVTTK